MLFFTGLHQPSDAHHFARSFISVHRLKKRKSDFIVNDWILDSGAFSTILTHGGYPEPVGCYAEQISRWSRCGNMLAAVAQDYMCEPSMLEKTGKTVLEHQKMTINRYDCLINLIDDVYILPVLQGYDPQEYVRHIKMYGDRLEQGAWVGVGSVCKRNSTPFTILRVFTAIKKERPDLRLHGFGVKLTVLNFAGVRQRLYSADSMAWSYHARINGRNGNSWKEARSWTDKIIKCKNMPEQLYLFDI